MQIAQVIGGYTLGGADLLRRAMGKKNQDEMDAQRDTFVAGAEKNDLSRGKATQLFDLMQKFAGYGFNKSHAAAYALLAYQTGYMKRHHNSAFMAANLSAVMDDTDKVRMFRDDAEANGVRVLPPDINVSDYRFVPVDAKSLRYGLGGVRGTGESAVRAIIEARKARPFTDLFDFCLRVDKRIVNRRAVEALVRAGAFDGLEANRASLLASVGRAMETADKAERDAAQNSLFGEADAAQTAKLTLVESPPWDLERKLTEEKTALGYCLSGHLFTVYEPALQGFPRTTLAKLTASDHTCIAGVVTSSRVQMTRRGRMIAVVIEDGTGQVEISVFNELFEAHRDKLKEDALVVVAGKVQMDQFIGGLRVTAEEIFDLDSLRERYGSSLRIAINGQADAKRLMEMLSPYKSGGRGGCPVLVHYENGAASCDVVLGEDWKVKPDAQLIGALAAWLAPENVQLQYLA